MFEAQFQTLFGTFKSNIKLKTSCVCLQQEWVSQPIRTMRQTWRRFKWKLIKTQGSANSELMKGITGRLSLMEASSQQLQKR